MTKKKVLICVAVVLVIALAVAGFFVYDAIMTQREIDGHIEAGDIAFEAGDYEEAIAHFALVPEDNRRFEEAEARIIAVKEHQVDLLFLAGDLAFDQGNYTEALSYFSAVPEERSRFAEAVERIAKTEARQLAVAGELIEQAHANMDNGQLEVAGSLLDDAERVLPTHPELAEARLRLEVALLVTAAENYYAQANFTQAYAAINAAIALDDTVETRYSALLRQIRFEEATAEAIAIMAAFQEAGLPIGVYVAFTDETDPNELLGRPGSYIAKINFVDARLSSSTVANFTNGGSIEIFFDQAGAEARKNTIDTLALTVSLAIEYSLVEGRVLLRLSSSLTPAQAEEYKQVFLDFFS